MTDDLRYPIGRWTPRPDIDAAACAALIDQIEAAPAELASAVRGLTDAQLDTPYRDGGWTPRQIVHHLADSHLNGYTRCKLAFTEESPVIKPYNEKLWAETDDGRRAPLSMSIPLLEALHQRWVRFLRSLDASAFARTVQHPERGAMTVADLVQLYAWHGRHHTAHILGLKARQGW